MRQLLPALLPSVLLAAPAAAQGDAGAGSAAERAVAEARTALEAIAGVPEGEHTFENTSVALDDLTSRLYEATLWTSFLAHVHPDLAVREEGAATRRAIEDFAVEIGQHEGAYRALRAFAATEPPLEGEDAELLETQLREFRRAGMELSREEREELKAIELELNRMELEFDENIRDDESVVALTREELAGVPETILEGFPRSNGLFVVTMKSSDVRPIFAHCEVPETRQRVSLLYQRRAGRKNVELLEQILVLRDRKAKLLGYENVAQFTIEERMAKTPENVEAFYAELRPKLREKALQDLRELTEAKREHLGDPDAELDPWDSTFYEHRLLETEYAVDESKVREYFPLESVVDGLFTVTQRLFGLEYRDVTAEAADRGRPTWHPDVRLYEVVDRATGRRLGEFYTDLFPRPNKYNHAAQFPIVVRKRWPDGSVSRPVVALVCNLTKPTADRPSLLSHSEVETLFHEFGHCLHSILTESNHGSLSGTSVARDFVEAPSQTLENWVWDAEVLSLFARHHETGEPLPRELLDGMLRARHLRSGIEAELQVWLGTMDLAFHTAPGGDVDTTAVCEATRRECTLFEPMPETWFHAAFGHLTGYEAGYYGYLWSLVYAQDMFTRFREHGLLDPEAGARYREKILSKGATADALELVRDYLGREPSSDAFLEHLGLAPRPAGERP